MLRVKPSIYAYVLGPGRLPFVGEAEVGKERGFSSLVVVAVIADETLQAPEVASIELGLGLRFELPVEAAYADDGTVEGSVPLTQHQRGCLLRNARTK